MALIAIAGVAALLPTGNLVLPFEATITLEGKTGSKGELFLDAEVQRILMKHHIIVHVTSRRSTFDADQPSAVATCDWVSSRCWRRALSWRHSRSRSRAEWTEAEAAVPRAPVIGTRTRSAMRSRTPAMRVRWAVELGCRSVLMVEEADEVGRRAKHLGRAHPNTGGRVDHEEIDPVGSPSWSVPLPAGLGPSGGIGDQRR